MLDVMSGGLYRWELMAAPDNFEFCTCIPMEEDVGSDPMKCWFESSHVHRPS